MKKPKRYAITFEVYYYEETDEKAKEGAKQLAERLDSLLTEPSKIASIFEHPVERFAKRQVL